MTLASPHERVPTHLVGSTAGNLPPALAIYGRQEFLETGITVTTGEVQLTDGVDTYNVSYLGRSLQEVAEDISVNAAPFEANALNTVSYLDVGDLTSTLGDTTSDEGQIVRLDGHVIKYREDLRVRLYPPADTNGRLPWYARIDTGQFTKVYKGIKYLFSVAEYDKQVWSTYFGKPFVDQTGSQVGLLTDRVLQLARRPVFWEKGNIRIRINRQLQSSNVIEDVDEYNGYIYLTRSVQPTDQITVDYTYRENFYVYRNINLNPTVNHMPQFVGQFVLYYLKPSSDDVGRTWSQTIFHSIAPTLEGAIQQIPTDDIPTVLLGALTVRQVNTITEVKLTDTRTRGGGIDIDHYGKAVQINRHLLASTDRGTWDVVPYPGNAVLVVDLPESLKSTLDVAEIQSRARRHIAMGVEPVIDYRQ